MYDEIFQDMVPIISIINLDIAEDSMVLYHFKGSIPGLLRLLFGQKGMVLK